MNFCFLKKYVVKTSEELKNKHEFYKLTDEEIENAEKRIKRRFPKELRELYRQVGFGFLCAQDRNSVDRIMDPESIADFVLGEDRYERDEYRDIINFEEEMAFFELGDSGYLSLNLTKENKDGICPILFYGDEIANSIEEFIKKMDAKTDYFINKE